MPQVFLYASAEENINVRVWEVAKERKKENRTRKLLSSAEV